MWIFQRSMLVAAVIIGFGHVAAEDSLYCGLRVSCYDVLGVQRDAATADIRRAYRKLSMQHHPDRGGEEAEFYKIATAYETLVDEESRENHDYFLDHPDEHAYNMYRYYKHKAAPKIGLMPIFLTLVTIISICQWLYWSHRHSQALHYALLNKRIRAQAKAEADRQDLLKGLKAKGDEEKILRQIIMQNLDLQGSFAPPVLTDVLWVRIVLSPYSIARYFWWLADWHYRIDWKGQELTPEDCEYLILRNLGWSVERWDCAEDADKDKMWAAEIWDPVKCAAYLKAEEEAEHEKWKNSAQYKRYKRWAKKEGRS